MKILSLKLRNFKGIRSFEIDTQGKDVNVFGDNGTGKTTLADAFMWLLFDKDSNNRKDFQIKTLKPDGEPEHGLEHSVEAALELEDGSQLILKKVFQEKWTKKRGSATAEFTGHTTDYFVDGVPVQKKEYDAKIAEIADEEIFRLLTDPRYFNEVLHWQKRRELLLEVCGDVSDAEVIATNAELSRLSDFLGNRTIEQHRRVIQARRTEINKELEKIPVRIDEVKLGLPDVSDITNPGKLQNDIDILRERLKAKQEELAQAKAGGRVAEKTKQLRMLEAEILELEKQCRAKYETEIQEKRESLKSVQEEYFELMAAISGMEKSLELRHEELASIDNKITTLRAKWHEENNKQFEFKQNDICPACGQKLPEEKLQEARGRALAEFNRQKAEKLEAISADGKQLKAHADAIRTEIEQLSTKIAEARKELQSREIVVERLKDTIQNLEQKLKYATANDDTFKAKYIEKFNLEKEIAALQENNTEIIAAIQKEIDEITASIAALEQAKARLQAREAGMRRIEELKEQERKLAAEYEELEQQLYLTEEFVRTKVRMLEDKINSKFKLARFKLFNTLVNGGIEECCETTFQGVPYSNLNNGARLNIGLDIINTLAEHFGFAPVVFIDNAESVTNILPTKGQQIRLIVSANDKKLRVEVMQNDSSK
ncbi:hypothetical protein CSTERTH_00960 [Thermoclostridium stercorarium subsp. thermolacticum DSM 2910]|uniref:Nuclease SbcCD subunit C n=1 Tax=Thermoclostridium stercorarium subsp. thermolacticum DSM 2910 TaxID=1121336 RepID=A0A1B1YA96_THEST|nr:AAA family ATPase [Thermoclostridium stercorarium]ANW97700.1 hypothetical protein CSTERTH_00960 [Thermoclostridium stercorarium subsp. thermolacticum DSM 2910]